VNIKLQPVWGELQLAAGFSSPGRAKVNPPGRAKARRKLKLALHALALCATLAAQDRPLTIAKQGWFYSGGREITDQGQQVLVDPMFVQFQIPAKVTAPYPIVLIHGQFQNGSNFLGTPDGRPGWAEYFVGRGFAVYVVDQPARGRSPYTAAADGPLTTVAPDQIERQFTAPEKSNLWPQAKLHTQWPGTGLRGDPVFEQFRASQNASMSNNVLMDAANRAAGAALLKRIGPAILLTHSRSGPFGWEIADDVPELVKGIVAVEPNGPPFYNVVPTVAGEPAFGKPWGIGFGPLTYDPPIKDPKELTLKREPQPQGKDLLACWFLETPRRLPHLAGIPVIILTAEASYHAPYDHCTSQYLTKAGVANEFVRLEDRNIRGNGHMVMLEKNNLAIANVIADWIGKKIKAQPKR
jgi:pimeloyl-ACP methyl ester carboxylesterase